MRINKTIGNVEIKFNDKRIERNMKEAQKLLNLAVRTDCEPLVPLMNGQLRRSATFPEGVYGGVLEYNTPYAHYQYEGIVYGPNIPIRDAGGNITGWYSPPSKHPTGRPLTYHTAGTGDHWFETAKQRHGADWLRRVKQTAGRD